MASRGSAVGIGTHRLYQNTQLIKQQAIKNKDELNKTKDVVNSNSDDIHQNKINVKKNTNMLNNIGNILLQSMLNFSLIGEKVVDTSENIMDFHMVDTFPVNLDYNDFSFKPLRTADYYLTGTLSCKSATEGLKGIEFQFSRVANGVVANEVVGEIIPLFVMKHHWEHNKEVQIPLDKIVKLIGSPTKQYQYQFKCKATTGQITLVQASVNLFKLNGNMA